MTTRAHDQFRFGTSATRARTVVVRRWAVVDRHLIGLEAGVHRFLVRHSIDALRITMGLVFLGFGVLKFFPGVSPAENLAEATIAKMTAGQVPAEVGLVITATLECAIGISLITTKWLRLTIYLLAFELLGILSPVVLLPGRLFAGPHHAPTLEGQYVLKDIILVAAAMVVATRFRGAKITEDDAWVVAVPAPGDVDRSDVVDSEPLTPSAGR